METSPPGPSSSGNGPSSDLHVDDNQRPKKKMKTAENSDGVSQQHDFIPFEITWKTIPLPPRSSGQLPLSNAKSLLDQRHERLQLIGEVAQKRQSAGKGPLVAPAGATQVEPSKDRNQKQQTAGQGSSATSAAATQGGLSKNKRKKLRLQALKEEQERSGLKQTNEKTPAIKEQPKNDKQPTKKRKRVQIPPHRKPAFPRQIATAHANGAILGTETPWMENSNYSDLPSSQAMFTRELCDFIHYMEPTEEEHQVRSYVFLLVEKEIQKLWPSARLVMYGSFRTRVYLPTSDMDMVVHRDKPVTLADMRKLKNHFASNKIGTHLELVSSAKVPLVKFNEMRTGIAVDISFDHLDGIQSGSVMTKFLEETPGLRSLIIILKHFLLIHNQNTPFLGGMGSYTLMIMIVSFLQMHPHVQSKAIDPEANLGVLLIEFFELYGLSFNYNRVGISIADGGSYIPKTSTSKKEGPATLQTFDPNNAANDTGRVTTQFPAIRNLFKSTYSNIITELQRRDQLLSTRSKEEVTKYRAGQHESLLKTFLPVSKNTIAQRTRVDRVYYDGVFQKMFTHPPPQKRRQPPVPAQQRQTALAVQTPLQEDGNWLDGEVDQLKSLCGSWQGDSLGMEAMLEMGRQLIVAQSKRTIALIEERQGTPMSDETRSKVFDETLVMVEKRLGFLEEAMKLQQGQMERAKALADLRRSEESTITPPSQEVEFVDAMDTDEEESDKGEDDDYFSDLMQRAEMEYGDSDNGGEDAGADTSHAITIESDSEEPPLSGAGHRNPENVHVSEQSILLPQLYSTSPSQLHGNSSRDEQLEAMLRRAEGLDD
ncbi:non-canonical poly(A) RNA polymerase PAPD5/7 [Entomortierella parvispora]|uniref:polynucleotide adenylyltransferase n=1 Tax=Entomortierella parvispora TaxID=205924 RepID=A0A9P3H430_9FUNG|nr:non-canonical poly(A) RNA polymerase PAPD5/7 [Entomortierella parvispora]